MGAASATCHEPSIVPEAPSRPLRVCGRDHYGTEAAAVVTRVQCHPCSVTAMKEKRHRRQSAATMFLNPPAPAGGSTDATEPPLSSGAGNAGYAPLDGGRHHATKRQSPRCGGTADGTRILSGEGRPHTAAAQTPEGDGIYDDAQPRPVECCLHALNSLRPWSERRCRQRQKATLGGRYWRRG